MMTPLSMQTETVTASVTMRAAPMPTVSQTTQPNGGTRMVTAMETTMVKVTGRRTTSPKIPLNGPITTEMDTAITAVETNRIPV